MFTRGKYKDRGFDSFDDYCRSEGIDPGRARRLRRVFKVFQRDLNLPISKVASIGFTNASIIAAVITPSNAEDWLDKAKRLSTRELKELVDKVKPTQKRRRKVVREAPGAKKYSYTPESAANLAASLVDDKYRASVDGEELIQDEELVFAKTFYLVGDQAKVLDTALEVMERRTGSDKVGYLLTCALQEWLAKCSTLEGGKSEAQCRFYLSMLEKRYGGKMLWIRDKNLAEKLNEFLRAEDEDQTTL